MAVQNKYSGFSSDVVNYIAKKTLPNVIRQLVVYQAGEPLKLESHSGLTYQATRYVRLPLPQTALSEGVPPAGESMTIQTVIATCSQWGDTVTVTDVADLTIKHPVFQKAIELVAMQSAETLERNTFNNLLAGTQINYVAAKGARGSLTSTDVLTPHELNRMTGALKTIGAPRYNGDEREDMKLAMGKPYGASDGGKPMRTNAQPHYIAVIHPLVATDLRENTTIVTAWSYSDVTKLYNMEVGEWGGIRFTESNLVPYWTGFTAKVVATTTTGGSLAAATYAVQVTGVDNNTGYETQVYGVSTAVVIATSGSVITLTTPTVTGFTYNVYISAGVTAPVNLGTGTVAGGASQSLTGAAPNSAIVITAVGTSQTPPAAPANGLTIYPTFIFGRGAYGQVELDAMKFTYLNKADKSDPLNQLRVVGWKVFYGTIILNNQFFGRIEAYSAFSATFG